MLSKEDNELITRVGPGTPMGEMYRRYWVPACLSSELPEPDCDPIRVRLLGESLVAFRSTDGRIGLLPENCAHRGASLFFGRCEEGGLRCLYHGWKYDVEGNVLDTPCELPGSVVKDRVKHVAYPVQEHGDIAWAYMGPLEKMPAFPEFQWTTVPATNRTVKKVLEECNWLQSLEGAMDPPHPMVLHDGRDVMRYPDDQAHLRRQGSGLEVVDTRYGLCHIATRPSAQDPERSVAVTIHPFVAPFTSYITGPAIEFGGRGAMTGGPQHWGVHLFVPADDHNNYYYEVRYHPAKAIEPDDEERFLVPGVDIDGTGRKIKRRLENDYLQDRDAMRAKRTFSGFDGKPHEDIAMIESMGPIYDRTKEHLGNSDVVTIALRRRLIKAVRDFLEGGDPPGLDPSIPYESLAGITIEVPAGAPWTDADADLADYLALDEPPKVAVGQR